MKVHERGQTNEGSNSCMSNNLSLKRLCRKVEDDCNGFRLFRNKEM